MAGKPYRISSDAARKVREWLREGRGVSVWRSIDLSDPGREVLTPAYDYEGRYAYVGIPVSKPHWKMGNTPVQVMESERDFEVVTAREVKRFHVAVRRGSQGFSLKVTDGGSRRIRREVEKAGDGAWHEFDYGDYDNAVIMAPDSVVPMEDWHNGA